jgi:hypothetical protein
MSVQEPPSPHEIYEQIRNLPQESLGDLAHYIEFLRFKTRSSQSKRGSEASLRIVKLGGIAKGYNFSPELLAAERRAMWQSLYAQQA